MQRQEAQLKALREEVIGLKQNQSEAHAAQLGLQEYIAALKAKIADQEKE